MFAGSLLRLSDDAMRLELCVTAALLRMSRADALALIADECEILGVVTVPTADQVGACLVGGKLGHWTTLVEGAKPIPAADSHVDLTIHVRTGNNQAAKRVAVKAGTVLAHWYAGVPGIPGQTLRGQVLSVRPPKIARLPKGPNTIVQDDGSTLVAACDGEVVLRSLVLAVLPMLVYESDVPANTTVANELPVFVCGSVLEGARVHASGEIYVQGDVIEAELRSRTSTVTVMGTMIGSAQRPCVIEGGADVHIGHARLASIRTGADLHIAASAWQCSLETTGNLFLTSPIHKALQDVQLHIGGAVFPSIEARGHNEEIVHDRQYVRAPCDSEAVFAVHDPAVELAFRECNVLDISAGGARCHVVGVGPRIVRGAMLQLKTSLPDATGQLIAIGRVVWVRGVDTFGLCFTQIMQRDQDRLIAYCFRQMQERPANFSATIDQRGLGHRTTPPPNRPAAASIEP